MATTYAVKQLPVQVCQNQAVDTDLTVPVDFGEANAATIQVFVGGTAPSATITVQGSSSQGGNYLTLPDTNATQAVSANTSFDVTVGSRWGRVKLSGVSGTFTIYVTPYVSPGSPRVSASIVVGTLAAIQAQTGALIVGTAGSISSGATGYLTGNGYWLDYNAGTPRFRVGSVAGGLLSSGISWDGTTLNVKGTITVSGGNAMLTDASNASGAGANIISQVNGAVTTINPGRVLISGAVTLAGWSAGADATFIDGGKIYAGSVTATQITVATLSALSANLGTITAGTITGGTVQTAASAARVVMDSTGIKWYDATTQRGQILNDGSGWMGSSTAFKWTTAGVVSAGGWTIGATTISATGGTFVLDNTVAAIKIGAATDYNVGDGIFIRHDGVSTYYFRVGTVAAGALTKGVMWDGTNFSWVGVNTSLTAAGVFTASSAVITGAITATSGAIGGWTIGATTISATGGTFVLDSNTALIRIGAATDILVGNGVFLRDTSGGVLRAGTVAAGALTRGLLFDGTNLSWVGVNTSLSAAGAFVASSATITGAITATSGSIGSFTIGTYLYTGTKTAWNDVNAGVHVGSDGIGIGNNVFTVNGTTGALVATSATITGAITASSGSITGPLTMSGATSSISIGATPPSSATVGTGLWLDRTGLYGLNANTQEFYVQASDGKAYFAGGNALIDATAIKLGVTAAGTTHLGWYSGSTNLARIQCNRSAGTYNILRIDSLSGQASETGDIYLTVYGNGSTASRNEVWIQHTSGTGGKLTLQNYSISYNNITQYDFSNGNLNLAGALYPGGGATRYISDNGSQLSVVGDTVFSNDLYSVTWTDYSGTSTVTGWQTPMGVKKIMYRKLGKLVFVYFELDGTSNATSVSFTLPYANAANAQFDFACLSYDNSAFNTTPARGNLPASSNTVTVYSNFAQAAWTGSGSKVVRGQFFYETT